MYYTSACTSIALTNQKKKKKKKKFQHALRYFIRENRSQRPDEILGIKIMPVFG